MSERLEAIGLAGGNMLEVDDFESLAMLADQIEVWAAHQEFSEIERARVMIRQWIEMSMRRREHFKTLLLGQQSNTLRLRSYEGHAVAV